VETYAGKFRTDRVTIYDACPDHSGVRYCAEWAKGLFYLEEVIASAINVFFMYGLGASEF